MNQFWQNSKIELNQIGYRPPLDYVLYILHKYICRGEHRKSLTLESWEGWQVIFSTQAVTLWECHNDIVLKKKAKVL